MINLDQNWWAHLKDPFSGFASGFETGNPAYIN